MTSVSRIHLDEEHPRNTKRLLLPLFTVLCIAFPAASRSWGSPVTLLFDDSEIPGLQVNGDGFIAIGSEVTIGDVRISILGNDASGSRGTLQYAQNGFSTYMLPQESNMSTALGSFAGSSLQFQLELIHPDQSFDLLSMNVAGFFSNTTGQSYSASFVGTRSDGQTVTQTFNDIGNASNYTKNLVTFVSDSVDPNSFTDLVRVTWNQGPTTRQFQFDDLSLNINAAAVPEPSFTIFGIGCAAAAWVRWRRTA